MGKSILFIFNIFPGIGGLEAVSNNIIDYIGKDFPIYTLSFSITEDAPVSSCIAGIFQFQSDDLSQNAEQFNKIVEEKKITHIINQGIYPHTTNIIFNSNRKKEVKIISALHGMPQYERIQYWQLPHIANASEWKKKKRKFLSYIKLNKQYNRYIKSYLNSYRDACIKGDKVVVLCQEYISPFVNGYHLQKYKDKVIAIENPLSVFFSEQEKTEWLKKKNQILFIGRLSEEKRVDIILDVWKRIPNDANWELVIIGDGNMREELQQMVANQQIRKVTFTGQVNHPEEYYESAKIILLTSRFEGFPMCLIEALRFGVTPLVFNISEGVRSILSGSGGSIIENNNSATMSLKLAELMNNEHLLHSLSEKARAKSELYTLEEIGTQWHKLIEKL